MTEKIKYFKKKQKEDAIRFSKLSNRSLNEVVFTSICKDSLTFIVCKKLNWMRSLNYLSKERKTKRLQQENRTQEVCPRKNNKIKISLTKEEDK